MFIYLVLMTIILAVGCFFKVNSTKTKQLVFLISVFTILAITASLRSYNVGIDTEQFYRNYMIINVAGWENSSVLRYEFGFFALCKILNYISTDPQLLIIVSSCFICFSVGRFIYKNSNDVIFSSFLFISLNIFSMYLNVMRQAIAISIILFAIEFLKKPNIKNIIIYILIVILAMQFHNSAIVMIIPLFFTRLKYTNISFIATIIASAASFVLSSFLWNIMIKLFPSYSEYSNSVFTESNYFAAAINALICIFILISGLAFAGKNIRSQKETKALLINFETPGNNGKLILSYDINAYLLSFALIFLVLTMRMTLFNRFSIYFTIFYITWIPNIAQSMTIKKDKAFLTFILTVFTLAYFLVVAIFRPEWYGVVPYQFFWEV